MNLSDRYRNLFTMALLIFSSTLFAITPGLYIENTKNWRITIEDEHLYMFVPARYLAWYGVDTLAICNYRMVRDDVIEVSSVCTTDSVLNSLIIDRASDSTLVDSIRLEIHLPQDARLLLKLGFECLTVRDSALWTTYPSRGEPMITITFSKKDLLYWNWMILTPDLLLEMSHIGDNLFRYPQQLRWLLCYDLVWNTYNVYKISVPLLTYNYFFQAQFENEYMLVLDDIIQWRGMNFVRTKQ